MSDTSRNTCELKEVTGVNLIGQGSYCNVYSCVFRGEHAALKIMREDLSPPRAIDARADLITEQDILWRLQPHPHIVRVLGTGCCTSRGPFIIMEVIMASLQSWVGNWTTDVHTSRRGRTRGEGRTGLWRFSSLRNWWKGRLQNPSRRLRLEWMVQATEALIHIHAGGPCRSGCIIHGDIKPSNMGIAANGDLKMFDFGLAQYYPGHVAGSGINLPQSKARGTLRYMAPETLRKEPLFNESADIYSFAIVFVELLSRENPYREYEGDVNAFLAAARMETGLRPAICTMFPKAHRRLLEHSWHEDKSFRPTARQLCSALHQMPTVCWV